jgi:hypothetical protein
VCFDVYFWSVAIDVYCYEYHSWIYLLSCYCWYWMY